ncbi:MAG: EAL domain-containing protein [Pseudomonadota bacterium]
MVTNRVWFSLVFVATLFFWLAGGNQLHRYMTLQSNLRHLEETAGFLAQRVERSIDFVVIAGTELLIAGQASCSADALRLLRGLVLRTSTVADMYLVAEGQVCSSFDEASADFPDLAQRQDWTEARNPSYRIGSIMSGEHKMLAVSWGLGTDLELVSAINGDAFLFDVLAEDLRSHGHIGLFRDGEMIAKLMTDSPEGVDTSDWRVFVAEGERYPVRIEIAVDPTALANLYKFPPLPIAIVWISFGVIGALALAYLITRRQDAAYQEVLRAINHKEISPFFQPIIDARSGNVIGCEALARWIKPSGEFVPPSRFIPLIEQSALNGRLLAIMFEQANEVLGEFLSENPDFYISFNVTPGELIQKNFVSDLTSMVKNSRLASNQICLEITERQLLASPETAAAATREIRRQGFRIAIDDAGTGHNGLAALQKLDVSTIKIDKYFIDHIDDDPRSRVMVDMFVSVARRYKMTTIAEGVETENQLAILKLTGVHAFQGYLFSKPLPAEKFLTSLTTEWAFVKTAKGAPDQKSSETGDERHALELIRLDPEDQNLDEAARLEALYRMQILDTKEEEVFDRIPRMITQALGVPMAAIALIDEDRRWFKSVAGGKRGQIPRRDSFCNVTIQKGDPTIVSNTLKDAVFRENVLVKDAPHIRAYLGVPLVTSDGYRIGSVCCVDKKPRDFSHDDIQLMKDMSLIVMEQMEMRTLALFDPLTSARTRRGFCSEAKHRLEHARLTGDKFAVVMLDIDHFKSVNDAYGHSAGDEILTGVGQRVAELLPDDALFGRMGGEEFAVALPGQCEEAALHYAETLRRRIEHPSFETKWGPLQITISVGVAQADGLTQGLEELLEQADWALYEAKAKGRNLVVTCHERVA